MNTSNEFDRVLELSDYDLDYDSLQEHLEDLVKLAGKVAGTDVSMVNLIDHYTQWTISVEGMDLKQMPREHSVCQHTIKGSIPFEIADLTTDKRTSDREFFVNEKRLKYYFGIPLETENGNNLGALCVLHDEARELSPEKVEFLDLIAKEVINRLDALKKIKQLREELDESNNTTRKVSHDIRGPVSGILGVLDMIRTSVQNGNTDDILSLIDLVEKGSKSVLELAESILAESGLFNNPNEEEKPEFTLQNLEQKLTELFTPQAISKGLKLEVNCKEEHGNTPIKKKALLQICGNLISNAIKFTTEGGKVEISLDVIDKEENKFLIVNAEDSGEGITQQKIDEILAGNASSSDGTVGEEGYGFGLKLVHHLITNMDGSINIESTKGEGSKFTIELPIS